MTEHRPRSILITGASSGIGAALARHYAAPGVHLFLSGRDAARLDEVAAVVRAAGAEVVAQTLDVVDRDRTRDFVLKADERAPLDLVIANAGVSAGTSGISGGGIEKWEARTREVFAINLGGMLNTVLPIMPRMTERGRGQIGLMASLAAFHGIPGASAYGASKAAVRSYGEGLRFEVADRGVGVSVICPGYVASRITAQNTFTMPLFMEAEPAARIIAKGLARNRARIAFPWPMYAAVWLMAALPLWMTAPLIARLPRKEQGPR